MGRGEWQSFCVLLADPKTEDGVQRIDVMTRTTDGFEIAEEDLRLRGPGEFLGTKQSGVPRFHFGNIVRDHALRSSSATHWPDRLQRRNAVVVHRLGALPPYEVQSARYVAVDVNGNIEATHSRTI